MVLVQKWPFFQLFIPGIIRQENVFYHILERKKTFLGYKNKKFKSRKIDIFPKRITHGFGSKMAIFPKRLTHGFGQIKAIFPTFFFKPIQARKISFTIF